MAIETGTKLGRYEIRSKIGAGGMGEVYQARDMELGRDVAVKVLPSIFSADASRLHRFQQEACAAGALNHPNVLIVHDIGAHDGAPYIVSELLEGETLRKRIGGTPLGQRRAIDYALQIANGLAAAHEKGIIHRDLKPDNVFITNDGRVKILDFGLAKLTQLDGDQAAQTDIPTRRVDTDPGVVMGTVGYMSPEQLKGRPVDQRTDIFSFGTILYEMLSGRRAFRGESAAETMSAILKEDPPDLSDSNKSVSPALERLVNHCLEKNPEARFHSARDVAFALESIADSAPQTISSAIQTPPGRKLSTRLWIAITALLLLVSIVAIASNFLRTTPTELHPVRFTVSLPDQSTFFVDVETHNASLSPDGRHLAFVATLDGKRMLWVRSLRDLAPLALDGTNGAYSPFWSPDSRYIAFFAEGKLKRIHVSGGSLQTVCSLSGEIDTVGTWGSSGEILFCDQGNAIYRVPAAGGSATVVLKSEKGRPAWVNFLPDGKTFLFYWRNDPDSVVGRSTQNQASGIYAASVNSPNPSLVLSVGYSRIEYASGHLIYSREGSLIAHPFDPNALRATGEPITLVQRLPYFDKTGWAEFSTSANGTIIYLGNALTARLVWFDRNGREIEQVDTPKAYGGFRLSPDGKNLLLSIIDERTGSSDLWIHDFVRKISSRFVYGPADDADPVWSPEGRRAAFFSCCEEPATLYLKELNNSGKGQLLLPSGFSSPWDWSADGRFIAISKNEPDSNRDIWVLPLEGDKKSYPLLQSEFNETYARFSPNGRWVAYVSNESGGDDIYVARFDNPKEKWRVSQSGGTQPSWRRNGKELFYFSLDGQLMAVPVSTEDSFESRSAVPLFKLASVENIRYDISEDGQSFLIAVNDRSALQTAFTVIMNWTSDLKR